MYENLMTLPLFKGVSYNRVSEIVGKTRLGFLKYLPGDPLVRVGEPCTGIKFIITGSVRLTIHNVSDRFRVMQTLNAPSVISPDFLFGRDTLYPADGVAIDTVSVMQIAKSDFISLLHEDEIILFNYLNILSTNAQKAINGVIALTSGSLEERIAFWIIALTQMDATDIVLQARQRDLYALFGVQRTSFMAALDSLRDRGIITYSTNEINVLSRRELRSVLLNVSD
jgi:CRP-like cAMP-binding protein